MKKIKKIPSVKSVMTPFPYWIDINSSIKRAVAMMEEHQIHHLPVKADGVVVGMVSDRDLKLTLCANTPESSDSENLAVKTICVLEPYIVDLKEPLDRVTGHMAKNRVGTAIVLKEGRLAGVFSSIDACRFLSKLLKDQFEDSDDSLIA